MTYIILVSKFTEGEQMVKITPEVREMICDICKKTGRRFRCGAKWKYDSAGLDMLGDPVCNNNASFDACDECHYKLMDILQKTIQESSVST